MAFFVSENSVKVSSSIRSKAFFPDSGSFDAVGYGTECSGRTYEGGILIQLVAMIKLRAAYIACFGILQHFKDCF